jgi:hypothetical protein
MNISGNISEKNREYLILAGAYDILCVTKK